MYIYIISFIQCIYIYIHIIQSSTRGCGARSTAPCRSMTLRHFRSVCVTPICIHICVYKHVYVYVYVYAYAYVYVYAYVYAYACVYVLGSWNGWFSSTLRFWGPQNGWFCGISRFEGPQNGWFWKKSNSRGPQTGRSPKTPIKKWYATFQAVRLKNKTLKNISEHLLIYFLI